MHTRISKILEGSAKPNGWVYRGTLESWNSGARHHSAFPSLGFTGPKPPDSCVFWFHLESNENAIVGFDWTRDKPNEVRTVNGSLPLSSPINFSYTSSHKKLNEFFADSKKQLIQPRKIARRDLFAKIGSFFKG